jgi:molybdate-binding protein/DNA-binding transcriptional regulator YhcF (GntR family)
MDEPLYQKIANSIRLDILEGRLKPGAQLPTIRELTQIWGCTQGTVQRAYQELVREGLITSRSGLGSHVATAPSTRTDLPLRRAGLIHKAESFILEAVNSGFSTSETEQAFQHALDRFRVVEAAPAEHHENVMVFCGSHDLALVRLSSGYSQVSPGTEIKMTFSGSLGGLIALEEGRADIAGCHLWDAETSTYNISFIRRLLPGKRVALVTLAERSLGLILPSGNPLNITGLQDLNSPGVKFINRQSGSGTRVWFDNQLKIVGLEPREIAGYENEKSTHSEIAQAIAEGNANAGVGLEASARSLGLDFLPLTLECYQLVALTEQMESCGIKKFFHWLASSTAKAIISSIPGYVTRRTGELLEIS